MTADGPDVRSRRRARRHPAHQGGRYGDPDTGLAGWWTLIGRHGKPSLTLVTRTRPDGTDAGGVTQRYLVFSDGGNVDEGRPCYGVMLHDFDSVDPDGRDGLLWWEGGVGTAERDEALAIVAARGYAATGIQGGLYGDERDDTYLLRPVAMARHR